MKNIEFLNYLESTFSTELFIVQKVYEDSIKLFGGISHMIIDYLSVELASKIFKPNKIYDIDSETSIIEVIINTGIHQELVFHFFYFILHALKTRNCSDNFDDWYVQPTYCKQDISSRFSFPLIQVDYNKEEARDKGVNILMHNPPILTLLPSIGVSQWTHGDTLITTYKRYRARINISIKIEILQNTTMLKALCMGVYDKYNSVVVAARIWQWYENSSDFEIPVEFGCQLETLFSKLHKVYFYWEGSPKNYSYLNRLAYRQDL